MTRQPSLLRGVFSFSSMTMISRVLGLVRDIAIAHVFGVSAATDAFFIAFRVPNFMRRLFAEGSFSTAFVPVFTEVKETGSHAELRELTSRVAGTLAGVLLVIVALGLIFAPQVATGFAPGALDQPHKFDLTIHLLRLTIPYILFVSLTALCGGILNSFSRFALPALTPVILNICLIAGALWLSRYLAVPIEALGWAVLAAGILQLLFLLPAIRRLGLLSLPRWGWNHSQVKKIMRLMLPTLFGSSVAQINLLLDTIVLSLLVTGSQTWMYQATRFLELPLGVFGVALGTVILPALSRHHVTSDREGFSRSLDWGLRMTLLIALPAMCGLLLLAEPLVATLFQNGHFNAFDSHMTAIAIVGLGAGVPAIALTRTLLPAFYSRQDTKTPVRAGVIALVVNMVANFALIALLFELWAPAGLKQLPWLEGIAKVPGLHLGMAIASSISNYLQFALLWRYLKRAGVYHHQPGWGRHWLRMALACAALAIVIGIGLWFWPWTQWTQERIVTRVWRLALLVCAGGAAYVAALYACGFRARDLRGA
ncbi:MAG: murein biosynthesis integral membrane protein MurJ [Rhodanobacteraceae bacterium]|nr:MAG: murein biosynthesis integral membrane protein MurJ [Rhodanobacteraceae bacterium]